MAAMKVPLLALALTAILAGCEGSARPIAGQESSGGGCTTCHGDAARGAVPPVVNAAPAEGAHLAHLQGSTFRDPLACEECHPVPDGAGHANGQVDFEWGALAEARGATPAYDATSGTCTNACHGSAPSPAWTSDASLGCASCHGFPPASAPHGPGTLDCSTCHPGTVLPTGELNRSGKLHLDGKVDVGEVHAASWASPAEHGQAAMEGLSDCRVCHGQELTGGSAAGSCATCHTAAGTSSWTSSCTFCHGDRASGRASPPVDTRGGSDPATVTVGAHAAHVGTTRAAAIGCDACHEPRGDVLTDPAHLDGDRIAEVVFGPLARTGGRTPSYARSGDGSATCASTYCHGGFSGGANATPSWTQTADLTCTSCHGNPPGTGRHGKHASEGLACTACHAGTLPSLHVNGAKDVVFSGAGTWSASSRTCSSVGCHGQKSW